MKAPKPTPAEGEELEWSAGPKTVEKVRDRLAEVIALSAVAKRAYMSGDYSPEGWKEYFAEINSPFGVYDPDEVAERAFDVLARIACEAWQMLFDPEEAIEGKVIDRTKAPAPAPGGGEA